jgi:hypothetical protein
MTGALRTQLAREATWVTALWNRPGAFDHGHTAWQIIHAAPVFAQ